MAASIRMFLLAAVFISIAVVVICVCGNPHRNDPLGILNRILTKQLPRGVHRLMELTGTTFLKSWAYKTYAFFFLQRNPFVMVRLQV